MTIHCVLKPLIERRIMTEELWINVLSWRNDPKVYVWNKTNRVITLSEHLNWFNKRKTKLSSEPVFAYIDGASFVGMARLDYISEIVLEVSLIIDPKLRGKGYGKQILADICEYAVQEIPSWIKLIAVVHCQNLISQRLFEGFGFEVTSSESNFKLLTYLKSS